MYAIVEIAGQQFKVEKDQKLFVNRLEASEGDTVSFDKVLLIDNDGKVNVGTPVIKDVAVNAKILQHLKGDKVIVFKKKRRKGYAVKNGHRQYLSQIQVESIGAADAKKAEPKKEKVAKAAAPAPKAKAAAKTTKKAGKDDLKKIEGIGPKVQDLLNNAGINTYADLAAKTAEQIKEIIAPAGAIYSAMTTDTWPKQAELARDGKWDELKKWQEELDGGKEK